MLRRRHKTSRSGGRFEFDACEARQLLAFTAAVNFQPASTTAATPAGYVVDQGQTYASRGNGFTYGWNADNTANVRARPASPGTIDNRYDTMAMMQKDGTFTWELAVPTSGTYRVHVVSGDPAFPSSTVKLNAESTRIIDGTTGPTQPWIDGWANVNVTDGKLTLTVISGSANLKLNYVEVTNDPAVAPVFPTFPSLQHPVTIGTNLDGLSFYSSVAPFNDLTTAFHRWSSVAAPYDPDHNPIQTNSDNYPLGPAAALTFATGYTSGDYQVSYRGTGTVTFSQWHGTATGNEKMFDIPMTNVQTVNGVTSGTINLTIPTQVEEYYFVVSITGIDSSNYVTDLHVICPDANPARSATYRPVFLDKLGAFDGPLRVMDWMQTNGSTVSAWANRTPVNRFSYYPSGVPYEKWIQLANDLHKDLWINVPHLANDLPDVVAGDPPVTSPFVKNLADLIRDTMDPTLKVYVEYSNEVWVGGSAQGQYVNFRASKESPAISGAQEMGKLTLRVAQIFKAEFGAARFASQVRTMLGAFIVDDYRTRAGLDYITTYMRANNLGRDAREFISGVAVAPYVGNSSDMSSIDNANLTLDTLFAWMNNWIDTTIDTWLKATKVVADQYEVSVESYEGGQHLEAGPNQAIKLAAQSDPRMGDLYRHLIRKWVADGGNIFGNFGLASKHTTQFWGVLPSITTPTSVRYAAIQGMQGFSLGFADTPESVAPALPPLPPPPKPSSKPPVAPVPPKVAVKPKPRVVVPPPPPIKPIFARKRLVARVFD